MKKEKLTSIVSCKIQQSKKAELKAIAKKKNSTLSEITRKLILNFIKEQTANSTLKFTKPLKNKNKLKPLIFGSK